MNLTKLIQLIIVFLNLSATLSFAAPDPFCSPADFKKFFKEKDLKSINFQINNCFNIDFTASFYDREYGTRIDLINLFHETLDEELFIHLLKVKGLNWNKAIFTKNDNGQIDQEDFLYWLIKNNHFDLLDKVLINIPTLNINLTLYEVLKYENTDIINSIGAQLVDHHSFNLNYKLSEKLSLSDYVFRIFADNEVTRKLLRYPDVNKESALIKACNYLPWMDSKGYLIKYIKENPAFVNLKCGHTKFLVSELLRLEEYQSVIELLNTPELDLSAKGMSLQLIDSTLRTIADTFNRDPDLDSTKIIFELFTQHQSFNPYDQGHNIFNKEMPYWNSLHSFVWHQDSYFNLNQVPFIRDWYIKQNFDVNQEAGHGISPIFLMAMNTRFTVDKYDFILNNPNLRLNDKKDIFPMGRRHGKMVKNVSPMLTGLIWNNSNFTQYITKKVEINEDIGNYNINIDICKEDEIFAIDVFYQLKNIDLWKKYINLKGFDLGKVYEYSGGERLSFTQVFYKELLEYKNQDSEDTGFALKMLNELVRSKNYPKSQLEHIANNYIKSRLVRHHHRNKWVVCPLVIEAQKSDNRELLKFLIRSKKDLNIHDVCLIDDRSKYKDSLMSLIIDDKDIELLQLIIQNKYELITGEGGTLDYLLKKSPELFEMFYNAGYDKDVYANTQYTKKLIEGAQSTNIDKWLNLQEIDFDEVIRHVFENKKWDRLAQIVTQERFNFTIFKEKLYQELEDSHNFPQSLRDTIIPLINLNKQDQNLIEFRRLLIKAIFRYKEHFTDDWIIDFIETANFDINELVHMRPVYDSGVASSFDFSLVSLSVYYNRLELFKWLNNNRRVKKNNGTPYSYVFLSSSDENDIFNYLLDNNQKITFPSYKGVELADNLSTYIDREHLTKLLRILAKKEVPLPRQTINLVYRAILKTQRINGGFLEEEIDLFFSHPSVTRNIAKYTEILFVKNPGHQPFKIIRKYLEHINVNTVSAEGKSLYDYVISRRSFSTYRKIIKRPELIMTGRLSHLRDRVYDFPPEVQFEAIKTHYSDFTKKELLDALEYYISNNGEGNYTDIITFLLNKNKNIFKNLYVDLDKRELAVTFDRFTKVPNFIFLKSALQGNANALENKGLLASLFLEVFKQDNSQSEIFDYILTLNPSYRRLIRFRAYNDKHFLFNISSLITYANDLDLIKYYHRKGVSFDNPHINWSYDDMFLLPLGVALHHKNFEIFKYLLSIGVDPSEYYVHDRFGPKDYFTIQYIYDNDLPFEFFELILKYDLSINETDIISDIVKSQNDEYLNFLLKKDGIDFNKGKLSKPLIAAVRANRIDYIRKILALDNINRKVRDKDGRTAADWAATLGYREIYELVK